MSPSKAIFVLALFILAGCGENKPTATLAQGNHLPGLAHAANAPIFDITGKSFTELVLSNGTWEIHDNGNWQTDAQTEDNIYEALQEIFNAHKSSGHEPKILISAEGNTVFDDIKKAVRGAARAGFPRVCFLVSTGSKDGKNHAFPLDFPLAVGPNCHPKIEPFMISLDAEGSVFTGSGAHRQPMDSDPADHALPKLNNLLKLYAAAAKAAQCQPVCHVYADPAVNYQRVVDLFSRFHAHEIIMLIIDLDAHIETTRGKIVDEQRLQDLKIKPRPPAPSPQPRPIEK